MVRKFEAIPGGKPPTQRDSPQFVIEIDLRGLDGRGMFAAVDAAIIGAPIGSLVRLRVGSEHPPTWLPWIEHPATFQFIADSWSVQSDWQAAVREAL